MELLGAALAQKGSWADKLQGSYSVHVPSRVSSELLMNSTQNVLSPRK